MPLKLLPMEESDLAAYENIAWQAFKSDLMGLIYPNGFSQADMDHGIHWALVQWRRHPDKIKFMKVIDTDLPADDPNGKMVGMSKWKIYSRPRTQEEADAEKAENEEQPWPPGINVPMAEEFFAEVGRIRKEQMGLQAYVLLDMLATLPEHHRRGIGAMHLRWGSEIADELGIPCYLESSPMGRPLYERMGYEVVEDLPFDAKKWGSDRDLPHSCMLRPAKPVDANS